MMRKALAAFTLVLATATTSFSQTDAEAARRELDAGTRAYRIRRFAEAEQHFRRALELDPEAKDARLYVARAAHQQYRPGSTTPENLAAGERAAAVYQEVLRRDPQNDDAYAAVVLIYGQMKREEKVNEWLLWRANEFSLPGEKRAAALVALAAKQWRCSYEITERPTSKKPAEQKPAEVKADGKPAEAKPAESKLAESATGDTIVYTMPADEGDFIKARECATEGTGLVEQALALDPKNPEAWRIKGNLILETGKLAEMEGDPARKAELNWYYEDAVRTQKRLTEEARKTEAAGQEETTMAAPVQMPEQGAPGASKPINRGILSGKALSKPMPAYPPDAKAAGAQGTVTVRVLVDEEGRVVEAVAISGHELLRHAAVTAARNTRFAPTRLSGQPVKVSGVLTYSFVIPKN